ncbi:MAG: hypothetical protein UX04_C0001G0085 [Microgenomates group bacterium GW2011_GWF2_45_18]|nr:MAG: hypothetical protein UW18_C0003G0145 [Microgenomates group bacterium GW2011_GWF1_44_10]KKU02314.1 MAG: hypothetical protein UX04_C0001G0085 [Microgenomates group bacterium GW2011_GWF2_45_18]OGJ41650.1 MAG: hypothetical protein A2378_02070 [Candidatus Pacebacteria bacterium RIFOXYB1_FULL_44_10]HAU99220.1 hypothetical protein [Candidatus Paceibacterota bacterium]HAX01751.1 hypothetical protein [Candidatus Paceibacterota bacterium]
MNSYDVKFYDEQRAGSLKSAKEIIPFLEKLLHPKSVIDVGCGIGAWLSVWERLGKRVQGIEGKWIDAVKTEIKKDKIKVYDLNLVNRIEYSDRADLVQCLEVAEHLHPSQSKNLVKFLTSLSNVVFFSAAIPFQGGVDHINERNQSYWEQLFADSNFEKIDCIRSVFWDNTRVEWWYAQNAFLYVNKKDARIKHFRKLITNSITDMYHPSCLMSQGKILKLNVIFQKLKSRLFM